MSAKASPLLGYNNNVRHKGRVFHIQTEDSGVRYGHIITHLFMDGGRILKSVKTSYAEHARSEERAQIVRQMMKAQHKAMFVALRDGKFDDLMDEQAQAPRGDASSELSRPRQPAKAESPERAEAPQALPVGPRIQADRRSLHCRVRATARRCLP